MAFLITNKYKQKVEIVTSKIGTDSGATPLAYFPVRITGDHLLSAVFTYAKADGSDLRFSIGEFDFESLPFEIELWDPATNSAVIHVRVPVLSNSPGEYELWIWLGDSSATMPAADDADGSQAVWKNPLDSTQDFIGVMHMNSVSLEVLKSDDFTTLDATYWENSGAFTIANNTLDLNETSGSHTYKYIDNLDGDAFNVTGDFEVVLDIASCVGVAPTGSHHEIMFLLGWYESGVFENVFFELQWHTNGSQYVLCWETISGTDTWTRITPPAGTYANGLLARFTRIGSAFSFHYSLDGGSTWQWNGNALGHTNFDQTWTGPVFTGIYVNSSSGGEQVHLQVNSIDITSELGGVMYPDSTSNANHGYNTGSSKPVAISDSTGSAQDFSPGSSVVVPNHPSLFPRFTLTVETTLNPDTIADYTPFYEVLNGSKIPYSGKLIDIDGDTRDTQYIQFNPDGTSAVYAGSNVAAGILIGQTFYAAHVYDLPSGYLLISHNGSLISTKSASPHTQFHDGVTLPTADLVLASRELFDGSISEFRLSGVVRSADWIATTDETGRSPATFATGSSFQNSFEIISGTSTAIIVTETPELDCFDVVLANTSFADAIGLPMQDSVTYGGTDFYACWTDGVQLNYASLKYGRYSRDKSFDQQYTMTYPTTVPMTEVQHNICEQWDGGMDRPTILFPLGVRTYPDLSQGGFLTFTGANGSSSLGDRHSFLGDVLSNIYFTPMVAFRNVTTGTIDVAVDVSLPNLDWYFDTFDISAFKASILTVTDVTSAWPQMFATQKKFALASSDVGDITGYKITCRIHNGKKAVAGEHIDYLSWWGYSNWSTYYDLVPGDAADFLTNQDGYRIISSARCRHYMALWRQGNSLKYRIFNQAAPGVVVHSGTVSTDLPVEDYGFTGGLLFDEFKRDDFHIIFIESGSLKDTVVSATNSTTVQNYNNNSFSFSTATTVTLRSGITFKHNRISCEHQNEDALGVMYHDSSDNLRIIKVDFPEDDKTYFGQGDSISCNVFGVANYGNKHTEPVRSGSHLVVSGGYRGSVYFNVIDLTDELNPVTVYPHPYRIDEKIFDAHNATVLYVDADGYIWITGGGRDDTGADSTVFIKQSNASLTLNGGINPEFSPDVADWVSLPPGIAHTRGYKSLKSDKFGNVWYFYQIVGEIRAKVYSSLGLRSASPGWSGDIIFTAPTTALVPDDFRRIGRDLISENNGEYFHMFHGLRGTGDNSKGYYYMRITPNTDIGNVSADDWANNPDVMVTAHKANGDQITLPLDMDAISNDADCICRPNRLGGVDHPKLANWVSGETGIVAGSSARVASGHFWVAITSGTCGTLSANFDSPEHFAQISDGLLTWEERGLNHPGTGRSYSWLGETMGGTATKDGKPIPVALIRMSDEDTENTPSIDPYLRAFVWTQETNRWEFHDIDTVNDVPYNVGTAGTNEVDKMFIMASRATEKRPDGATVSDIYSKSTSDGSVWDEDAPIYSITNNFAVGPTIADWADIGSIGAPVGTGVYFTYSFGKRLYVNSIELLDIGMSSSTFNGLFGGQFNGGF